jgi:hypothetical protein
MKKFVARLSNKQSHLMTLDLIKAHASYLKSPNNKGVLPFSALVQMELHS